MFVYHISACIPCAQMNKSIYLRINMDANKCYQRNITPITQIPCLEPVSQWPK